MQNYKKNFVTRTLAWVLTVVMVVTMLPMGVFAETYTEANQIKTTDWSEKAMKEREAKTGSWPLSMKNRLVRVSESDPVKTPDLNYVGVYKNAEGREVIRLTFNAYVASANQWDKLLIRLPKELAEKFEEKNPESGIYKGKNSYGIHDAMDMDWIKNPLTGENGAKVPLEKLGWNVAGGQNVYGVDLYQNGSMKIGSRCIPIDLVLKEGESIKNLGKDLLIQGRLTDKNYERVYMRSGERTQDYMQYTFSTIIPFKDNYAIYSHNDLSIINPEAKFYPQNKFHSTVSSVKFDIPKGYLEVYYRQSKTSTGSGYAIRQSVESGFYDLLETRNGMVGEVYIMGADAKLYNGRYDKNDPTEPTTNYKIQFAEDDIYKDTNTGIGFIQIAGSEWDSSKEYKNGITTKKSSNVDSTAAILNGTAAGFGGNGGVYTVVRYFIKSADLKKLVEDSGLKSYTFRTSILRENKNKYGAGPRVEGYHIYEFTNDKERILKRGDKVDLVFNAAQYNRIAGTADYVTVPEIIIGDDNYNINFINSLEFDSNGTVATWTVPFDMMLDKDEKITVKAIDYDNNKRATNLDIKFSETDVLSSKLNKVDYSPIEMKRSASLTGGALTSTTARPNVDEIFTDSKNITGHSFFDGAEINIKYIDPATKEEVKQTISAAGATDLDPDKVDYSKILTKAKYVNGEAVDAFPFDTTKPNNGGAIQGDPNKFKDFKMPTLKKDMAIKVDNLDVLSSFIPSGDVVEQVQTKFHFDYQWDKNTGKKQVDDKIAPLNEKYLGDEGYTPNGFEGEHIKYAKAKEKDVDGKKYQNVLDHDGNEYDLNKPDQKEAFMKRQFPEDPDRSSEGLSLVGWSTMKPEDFAAEYRKNNAQALEGKSPEDQAKIIKKALVAELKKAENELKTADQWKDADKKPLKFTRTSPVIDERTVYAVYDVGATITLHSNKNAQDDHTYEIQIHTNDFKDGKAVITIPEPYYNEKDKGTFEGSELEAFKPEGKKTFAGWTLTKDDKLVLRDKIELSTYNTDVENLNEKVEKKYFNFTDLRQDGKNYLPSEYKLELTGTYEDWVKKGNIDLYAQYRDFIKVSVDKRFRTQKDNGTYSDDDDVEVTKKHPAKIGLIYRTAVTDWTKPTVHSAANYSALPKGSYGYEETLQDYNPIQDNNRGTQPYAADVEWMLPGFDKYGQRLSYAAVEISVGEEENYYKFGNDWGKLGIRTHNNLDLSTGTIVQDPDAPKDPIRPTIPLAKSQDVALKDPQDNTKIDTFTAATYREAVNGKKEGPIAEVKEYKITMTNIPVDVPKPYIQQAYAGEKSITINYFNEKVDGMTIKFPGYPHQPTTLVRKKVGNVDVLTSATTSDQVLKIEDNTVDKTVTLTIYPTSTDPTKVFNVGDKFEAKNFIGSLESKPHTMTVEDRPDSNKVVDVKQTPNENGDSVITMNIPNPTVKSPKEGTKYVLVKDDGNGNYPTPDDIASGKVQGVAEKEITPGTAPGAELKFVVPKEQANNGDKYKIVSIEPRKNPVISDVEITLDKIAEFEKLEIKDSRFRIFTEITGQIAKADIPQDGKIVITINGENKDFTTTEGAIEYLNRIKLNDGDKVSFKVVDDLGNEGTGTAIYEQTKQLDISVDTPRARRAYIYLKSEQGATIKITVRRGDQVLGTTTYTATGQKEKVSLDTGRLQKGDVLVFEGTLGKAYSNPYALIVR